ncbi:MAG: (2Fe-2S) ferredoxin domain-containing protein [Gemmatimonadetes bacterium]|nr:(2Fe-2S) ferredoxin domain-containing protein [Gemmatimonadota bacterium]
MSHAPFMERYSRHVLVCTGGYCHENRAGRALYARLAALLQREGLLFGPTRVKRSEAPCLGVCAGGPIVCVYPEGVWYARVDDALLERIVVEHCKHGRVVEEAVFHRLHPKPATRQADPTPVTQQPETRN